MSESEAGAQFAHSPVPEDLTVPGWRVGLIVAGFSIGLPDFLNGAQNAQALGLVNAILAAFLAGLALCAGGLLTAAVSVRTRLSTYLLARRSFGYAGAGLINVVIALIHFCWFGVNVSFFAEAAGIAARANGLGGSPWLYIVIGSTMMASATLIGFAALDRLAICVVPILAMIFALLAVLAWRHHGLVTAPLAHPSEALTLGTAISALIGAYMLAVTTMPDLTRFVRDQAGAVTAMAISFPLATPLMMTAAALPALATGETSAMRLVGELGLGTPLLFVLTLPTVTVNALNLYSASLALSSTFRRLPRALFIGIGASAGAVLAMLGILDYFIPFLLVLGLIVPPIAAIYVIDSWCRFGDADPATSVADAEAVYWPALAAWGLSIVAAFAASRTGLTLTTVPALDATLIAAACYALLRLVPITRKT